MFCFTESNDRVDVDVFLLQVCSKRRGGSMTSVSKTLLKTVSIPVNPTREGINEPLVITHECFNNGHILPIKPLILCLCVNTSPINGGTANGQCNGRTSSDGIYCRLVLDVRCFKFMDLSINIDLYIGDNKFVMKKLIKFILTIWKLENL